MCILLLFPPKQPFTERLQSCLQEGDELPTDFTQLFDDTLYKFDTNGIPDTIEAYKV